MPLVVAFISQKGGVGKSTLARALAAVAASADKTVRLADLDVQQRTLVLWEKTRKQNKISPPIAVHAFTGAEAVLASAIVGELLILDTSGRVTDATLELVHKAQLVVQPTGPSRDDLLPAVLLFRALSNLGIPRERLTFALCRTLTRSEEDAARDYLRTAGYPILPGAMPERAAYRRALDCGQSPVEIQEWAVDKRADTLMRALPKQIETSWFIHQPPASNGIIDGNRAITDSECAGSPKR